MRVRIHSSGRAHADVHTSLLAAVAVYCKQRHADFLAFHEVPKSPQGCEQLLACMHARVCA